MDVASEIGHSLCKAPRHGVNSHCPVDEHGSIIPEELSFDYCKNWSRCSDAIWASKKGGKTCYTLNSVQRLPQS